MVGIRGRAVLVAAGLAAVVADAGAQRARPAAQPAAQGGVRPIRFGQPAQDSLTASLDKFNGHGPFRVYRFEAKASKRYVITMEAPDMDAYLTVMKPVGPLTEELASDDDGAADGTTNSRLRFRPPADGAYLIVAQSLSEDGTGAYTLTVNEIDPPPAPMARPLALGKPVNGELTEQSSLLEEEGDAPYDLYTITGQGRRVRIVMESEAFDAYLEVRKLVPGAEPEVVASNDDGGGGTNARITLVLDGEYQIVARALGAGSTGAYVLRAEGPPPTVVTQRDVRLGETLSGELADTDAESDEIGFFDEYVVQVEAGQAIRLTLRSEDFDAYLRFGTGTGDNFSVTHEDDDGAGELNSLLVITPERSGRYTIRVSSLGAGNTGAYTLVVERAP